jgi:S1-C subfamily serine protease
LPAVSSSLECSPGFDLDHSPRSFHFARVLRKIAIVILLVSVVGRSLALEPERSVIQIFTFRQEPDWTAPWRFDAVQRAGGSGFVIKGKRIMTNAHVIGWNRQIVVRKYQDPRPYLAKVEFAAHDCDLALLKVEDESFFDELPALEFGELPKVRSQVVTYGYPAGGEEISYTRGVVSRVEMSPYSHIGNRRLLSVQTDAAINPGNSGGPVIQDDRIVGVAFQGIPGLENTGFFIPPSLALRFLKDVDDGKYDGVPMAGIGITTLQNPAYRALLKLPDNNTGARVDRLRPGSKAAEVLRPDDVILRVGEYPVASDATILYQGNRVFCGLAFQLGQSGDSVPVEIWREGKAQTVPVKSEANPKDSSEGNQFDLQPRYYVFGGLVFTPLSLDYLRDAQRDNTDGSGTELTYELYYRTREQPDTARPEPVVLSSVLSDEVNANFTVRGYQLVDRINGVRIEKLEDVIRAFETSTNAYDLIEFGKRRVFECLNHADAVKANADILKTYGVPRDRHL